MELWEDVQKILEPQQVAGKIFKTRELALLSRIWEPRSVSKYLSRMAGLLVEVKVRRHTMKAILSVGIGFGAASCSLLLPSLD
jgi:hypothetical protein